MDEINKLWTKIDELEERLNKARKAFDFLFAASLWNAIYTIFSTFALFYLVYNLKNPQYAIESASIAVLFLFLATTLIIYFLFPQAFERGDKSESS